MERMTREQAIERMKAIFDGEQLNDGMLPAPGFASELIDEIYDSLEFRKGGLNEEEKFAEIARDKAHVNYFADAMRIKMAQSVMEKDRYGWVDTRVVDLERLLHDHWLKYLKRGGRKADIVDIGCIAMMIWHKIDESGGSNDTN